MTCEFRRRDPLHHLAGRHPSRPTRPQNQKMGVAWPGTRFSVTAHIRLRRESAPVVGAGSRVRAVAQVKGVPGRERETGRDTPRPSVRSRSAPPCLWRLRGRGGCCRVLWSVGAPCCAVGPGWAVGLCCPGLCAGCRPFAEALDAPGQDSCGAAGVVQGGLVGDLLEEPFRVVSCCFCLGEGGGESRESGVFDDLLRMLGHDLA